jgi:hypothetical protein
MNVNPGWVGERVGRAKNVGRLRGTAPGLTLWSPGGQNVEPVEKIASRPTLTPVAPPSRG